MSLDVDAFPRELHPYDGARKIHEILQLVGLSAHQYELLLNLRFWHALRDLLDFYFYVVGLRYRFGVVI